MARKKGKRQRHEPGLGASDWPIAGTQETDQESGSEEMAASAESFMSKPLPAIQLASGAELQSPIGLGPDQEEARVTQEEPSQREAGRRWEPAFENPPRPAPGVRGFFARLSRWFMGLSEPVAISPEAPAPPPTPVASAVPPPAEEKVFSEPSAAPAPQREPIAPPAKGSDSPPLQRPESPRASRVDHVLAVLTLERVLPELDAARRELEEMKITSNLRIRQLEAERDQLRAEKSESDSRARTLRKGRDDQEREAQEVRRKMEERIRQLEAEREQRRSESGSAVAEQHDLRLRIRQLEAMLDIKQAGRSAAEWAAFESRVRTLEEELEAAQHRARQQREAVEVELDAARERAQQEKASFEARFQQIETERAQLAAKLATKEEELHVPSRKSHSVPARVKELEAELAEWKARAAAQPKVESPPPPSPAAPPPAAADAGRLVDLYQQTMSRLTVILASADLLAMNPRIDSSVRETAQEIRNQGKLLADIIKSFTLPPDTRKAE